MPTGGFDDWPKKVQRAVLADLYKTGQEYTLNSETLGDIARRHETSPRRIIALAVSEGLPIVIERPKKTGYHPQTNWNPTATAVHKDAIAPDRQYGVLQGPANLVGCLGSLWGWAILLFLLAGLLALVTGNLS